MGNRSDGSRLPSAFPFKQRAANTRQEAPAELQGKFLKLYKRTPREGLIVIASVGLKLRFLLSFKLNMAKTLCC